MKNKILFILAFTILHAILSWLLFLKLFSMTMHRFNTGETANLLEQILEVVSTILLCPLCYPLDRWGGRCVLNVFPGLWGYIPLLLNSLVWAIIVYLVYNKLSSRRQFITES